nr:hypothetical protein [Streptomyces aureus]
MRVDIGQDPTSVNEEPYVRDLARSGTVHGPRQVNRFMPVGLRPRQQKNVAVSITDAVTREVEEELVYLTGRRSFLVQIIGDVA